MKKIILTALVCGLIPALKLSAQMGMEMSFTAPQFASLENAKVNNLQPVAPAKVETVVPILETKAKSLVETEKNLRVEVAEKNKNKKTRKEKKKEQQAGVTNKRTFLTW